MGKRTYRAVEIKAVVPAVVKEKCGQRVIVAIDVAKELQFAALSTDQGEVVRTIKWSHPAETRSFVELCVRLAETGLTVETAMEPSGTYGDALRGLLLSKKFEVFRVSGKRVHDAAEVFDGVPSNHDPKAAFLIAKLHAQGRSEAWPLEQASTRELEALQQTFGLHHTRHLQILNRLEALTARHWPELTRSLSLDTKTLEVLLQNYGSPAAVAADPVGARLLMKRTGGSFLSQEVIEAVVSSASQSVGLPMEPAEVALMKAMATEAGHARQASQAAEKPLVAKANKVLAPTFIETVGAVTAAVLVASGLDPKKYSTPRALEKAAGLNLREFSSGKKKGGLHITKRGDSLSRMMLYMAVLRLIQRDPVLRAWHRAKVARDGGKLALKSTVALMRKLIKALWHVGRGATFDSSKLFDADKLGLAPIGPTMMVPGAQEARP